MIELPLPALCGIAALVVLILMGLVGLYLALTDKPMEG